MLADLLADLKRVSRIFDFQLFSFIFCDPEPLHFLVPSKDLDCFLFLLRFQEFSLVLHPLGRSFSMSISDPFGDCFSTFKGLKVPSSNFPTSMGVLTTLDVWFKTPIPLTAGVMAISCSFWIGVPYGFGEFERYSVFLGFPVEMVRDDLDFSDF